MVQFSRTVAQSFGRLDAVINLVPLDGARLDTAADAAGIERKVAERLLLPFLLSKIAANRMSLCYADGLVLNIATLAALRGVRRGPSRGRQVGAVGHDPRPGPGMGRRRFASTPSHRRRRLPRAAA